MIIESIKASVVSIPFKVSFKHSSAERSITQSLWVEIKSRDGAVGYGEGCPREYVTNENLESTQLFIATHLNDWLANIFDLNTTKVWLATHRAEIDANPAAWSAVEIALLDLIGKETHSSVESVLGLGELERYFYYSAVIGDAPSKEFKTQLDTYQQSGFRDFKIKLSGNLARDREKIQALRAIEILPAAVRADANNFWLSPNECIQYLKALDFPFHAIEEPLQANDYNGMMQVATALNTKIILDESLLNVEQFSMLENMPQSWIVNLRVSKMGGLIRSLEILESARNNSIGVIIGAHVGETSLLTRAALTIASQAGDILKAQEGAFGTHLLKFDVIDKPIMFGKNGILDIEAINLKNSGGFGLEIESSSYLSTLS